MAQHARKTTIRSPYGRARMSFGDAPAAIGTVSPADVATASAELARMRKSLSKWLKYRSMNDAIATGSPIRPLKKPLAYAQRVIAGRDLASEQDLATKLSALLSSMFPSATLPNPDVTANPAAAVQLAQMAISGNVPVATSSPSPTSGWASGSMWPLLIIGGLLLVVLTMVKTSADIASQSEQAMCIAAGGCTDYSFWLEVVGIATLAWFAWSELGLEHTVKRVLGTKEAA